MTGPLTICRQDVGITRHRQGCQPVVKHGSVHQCHNDGQAAGELIRTAVIEIQRSLAVPGGLGRNDLTKPQPWHSTLVSLDRLFDSYGRTARLLPALLVMLPVSLTALATAVEWPSWLGRLGAVLVASGSPVLATQAVRDLGRRVETDLFVAWGGPPTANLLRWSGPEPFAAVSRRHDLCAGLLGLDLPSVEAERVSPETADEAYAVAVAALRERTRDRARFPLVFAELKSYGFRRNLFGCRSLGTMVTVVALAVAPALALLGSLDIPAGLLSLLLFDVGCLLVWRWLVTADWVRLAAENYARQLLASLEVLSSDRR